MTVNAGAVFSFLDHLLKFMCCSVSELSLLLKDYVWVVDIKLQDAGFDLLFKYKLVPLMVGLFLTDPDFFFFTFMNMISRSSQTAKRVRFRDLRIPALLFADDMVKFCQFLQFSVSLSNSSGNIMSRVIFPQKTHIICESVFKVYSASICKHCKN